MRVLRKSKKRVRKGLFGQTADLSGWLWIQPALILQSEENMPPVTDGAGQEYFKKEGMEKNAERYFGIAYLCHLCL